MRTALTFILTIFIISFSMAQDIITEKFKTLYEQEKYEEIIKDVSKKNENLTAEACYYIGKAFYMKEEDKNASIYFDKAIEKGPIDKGFIDGDIYYFKAMILYYASQYKESIKLFDKAISFYSNEADFFSGKADAYSLLENIDSAIVNYDRATKLNRCKPNVYLSLGNIYMDMKQYEKAQSYYKIALGKLSQIEEDYRLCSYNIGLTQQLLSQYSEMKETFEKHILAFPNDYLGMQKLIQAYYSLSEFDKAKPYKEKLYLAFKDKTLPKEMKDGFCFDQFIWKNKRVLVFENFEENKTKIFVKHVFYIMDENGNNEFTINSESSLAIRSYDSKNKYVLCLEKNNNHYTFWQFMFNDDYKYPELKNNVIDILEDKAKPGSSLIQNKN